MKKLSFVYLFAIIGIVFSGCVTKSKYLELENRYKTCTSDLTYMTAEKIDFENLNKELNQKVSQLTTQVEQLKADTTSLSRRLRQSERDLVKIKMDYDDLLKNFTDLNMSSNTKVNALLMNIDSIKSQLKIREDELNEKEARLAELHNILKQKDEEVRLLKEKVTEALKGFIDKGLNVYEKNGKVYVSMDEKLLFASGSWEVNAKGVEALKELSNVLETEAEINVLIEGHTDNVPYRGAAQVKDNWDLSVMRATAVVKVLLKGTTIDSKRITAAGRSEYAPVDPADSQEARAKNRRTEIILTPKLDELFKIIDNN